MSSTSWLKLGERTIYLEDVPKLLDRSGLLMPLFRSLLIESCIANIVITEQEQIAFQRQFLKKNNIESPERLAEWLRLNNLSEEEASKNMLEALQLERFKINRFGADVERVFLETKGDRDRVVYSLLRLEDRAPAYELYLRLADGDSTFTDLSSVHSAGPERDTGGLIGPIPLGRLHPRVAELMRISKPGQLWEPLQIDGLWVIVRLDKFLPAQLDEAMESQIRDECFNVWLDQQMATLMDSYRNLQSSGEKKPVAGP